MVEYLRNRKQREVSFCLITGKAGGGWLLYLWFQGLMLSGLAPLPDLGSPSDRSVRAALSLDNKVKAFLDFSGPQNVVFYVITGTVSHGHSSLQGTLGKYSFSSLSSGRYLQRRGLGINAGASLVAQMVKNLLQCKTEPQVRKIPWRRIPWTEEPGMARSRTWLNDHLLLFSQQSAVCTPGMSKCTSTVSFALFQEDFFPFVGTEVILIS